MNRTPVQARYLLPNGAAASGSVTFTPATSRVQLADGTSYTPQTVTATLDGTGLLSTQLGPGYYTVSENTTAYGPRVHPWPLFLPDAASGVLNLTDHLAPPPSPGVPTTGVEIDYAESSTVFDVKAIGAVLTPIPQMAIVVPPQPGPFEVEFSAITVLGTGTAAAGSVLNIWAYLYEFNSNKLYGAAPDGLIAVNGAAQTRNGRVRISRRVEANTVPLIFYVQAQTGAAVPANWGSAQLYASNAPVTGFYDPMFLRARSL